MIFKTTSFSNDELMFLKSQIFELNGQCIYNFKKESEYFFIKKYSLFLYKNIKKWFGDYLILYFNLERKDIINTIKIINFIKDENFLNIYLIGYYINDIFIDNNIDLNNINLYNLLNLNKLNLMYLNLYKIFNIYFYYIILNRKINYLLIKNIMLLKYIKCFKLQ